MNVDHDISIFNIEEIFRENLKTKKREKIFYTEISLEEIPDTVFSGSKSNRNLMSFIKYNPISEFPSSVRDFSFSIKNPDEYENVISIIENFNNENLKDSFIFDFYLNEKIGEIKIGIRLIFQSALNTLSEKQIRSISKKLLKPLIDLDGVSIPGLDRL